MLFRNIYKIWKPAMYQGKSTMKGYFEGWYYKLADKEAQNVVALIPGVSFDKEGKNPHCFIQFLDDSGISSHYFSYDIKKFSYSPSKAEINIGDSFFSPTKIAVNIDDKSSSVKGTLNFKDIKPWPVSLFSPGAMGWYAFVPLMECYHGVLSFDHLIEGQLELNRKSIDFSGGRGYTEKDWGRSFPSYHIWIQTNHFNETGTSLMVSIANVPWLRKSFDGFLVGLWHDGRLYRFTTYTGAKIVTFEHDKEKVVIHVQSKRCRLEMEVSHKSGAALRTPVVGEMKGRLSEALNAETKIRLYRIANGMKSLVYEDIGRHAGLEIEGAIPTKFNQ